MKNVCFILIQIFLLLIVSSLKGYLTDIMNKSLLSFLSYYNRSRMQVVFIPQNTHKTVGLESPWMLVKDISNHSYCCDKFASLLICIGPFRPDNILKSGFAVYY